MKDRVYKSDYSIKLHNYEHSHLVVESFESFVRSFDRDPARHNSGDLWVDEGAPDMRGKTPSEGWYEFAKEDQFGKDIIESATRLLDRGWEAGAKRITKMSDKLTTGGGPLGAVRSIKRKRRWKDEGDELCPDRLHAGKLDVAWSGPERNSPGVFGNAVNIGIQFGGNCSLSAEQLFWNGAAGLVIADALSSQGYQVSIVGLSGVEVCDTSDLSLNVIVLKDFGEHLSVDSLASVVCHAGVFRTFGFMTRFASPIRLSGGLGRSTDVTCASLKLHRRKLEEVIGFGKVLIPKAAYSKEACEASIEEFLKENNLI